MCKIFLFFPDKKREKFSLSIFFLYFSMCLIHVSTLNFPLLDKCKNFLMFVPTLWVKKRRSLWEDCCTQRVGRRRSARSRASLRFASSFVLHFSYFSLTSVNILFFLDIMGILKMAGKEYSSSFLHMLKRNRTEQKRIQLLLFPCALLLRPQEAGTAVPRGQGYPYFWVG